MHVKSLQLCPILCDPIDCSLPGFSVHGILQARILEWEAILFSRGSSRPRDQTWVSCIAGRFFTAEPPGKPPNILKWYAETNGVLRSSGQDSNILVSNAFLCLWLNKSSLRARGIYDHNIAVMLWN